MTKLAAAIIAAISIGAIGGAVAVQQQYSAAHAENEAALASLTETHEKLQRQLRDAETMSEQLRQRNLRMEERLQAMQSRVMEVQEELARRSSDWEMLDWDAFDLAATAEPDVDAPSAAVGASDAALGEDEAPRRRGREPGDREAREARREEFIERFREQMQASLDDVILSSDDPAEQERMALMGEYADYMTDLRRRMADAEDEEARRALFQEMAEAGAEMRALVVEQQDHVLRNVARQHGITDPQEQQAFVSSLREAQASTAYRGPTGGGLAGMMGGGRGGGAGGPGGWPGRGGGGGRPGGGRE